MLVLFILNSVALVKYFDYVKSLEFEDEPNYELTRKILREELIKMEEEQRPFDWLVEKQWIYELNFKIYYS